MFYLLPPLSEGLREVHELVTILGIVIFFLGLFSFGAEGAKFRKTSAYSVNAEELGSLRSCAKLMAVGGFMAVLGIYSPVTVCLYYLVGFVLFLIRSLVEMCQGAIKGVQILWMQRGK